MPAALWRIDHFGRERRQAGDRYWWDNRRRGGDLAVFQLILAGGMLVRDAQGDHGVPAGSAALFTHPGESCYGQPDGVREPLVHAWVGMRGAGLLAHWEELIALRGPVVAVEPEGALHRQFLRLEELGDPRRRPAPEVVAAAVHAFVVALYAEVRAAASQAQRPVERAIDALLAAPAAAWSLKEVAEAHGVSREHLARAFVRRLGRPPAAWLAEERVRRAIELLERTGLPMRAVREQAGFASGHTLIRRVRMATGLTPGEVRQRAQSRQESDSTVA